MELLERVLRMSAAAWPQADQDAIRQQLTRLLSKDGQTFEVTEAGGVEWRVKDFEGTGLWICERVPLWQETVVAALEDPPIGLVVKPLDKPMARDEAKTVAEGVMARLWPDGDKRSKDFAYVSDDDKKPEGYPRYHRFEWMSRRRGDPTVPEAIRVYITAKDGSVRSLRLMGAAPWQAKITKKAIAKKLAAVIPNSNPTNLYFQVEHYFTSSAPTWKYGIPPPPKGSERDRTFWDARTGDLLYSEVINRGTAEKPYRSPNFYFTPGEKELVSRLKQLLHQDARRLFPPDEPQGQQPGHTPMKDG